MGQSEVSPVLKRILIAAIAIFVVGVSVMLSDIYVRLGCIEHSMEHVSGGHK